MRTSIVTLFASGLAVAVAQDLTMSALPMSVQQIPDGQVQAAAPTVYSISAVGGSAIPVGAAGASETGTSVGSAASAAVGGLVVASPAGTPQPTFTMSTLPEGSSLPAGGSGSGSAGNSSGGSSAAGASGGSSVAAAGASSTANLLGAAGASATTSGVAQVSTAGAAPMATAAGIGFVGLVAALVI